MSGLIEVGNASNPQASDPSISQAVVDQFISNGVFSPNGGGGGGVQRGGRDYNLPPPGCDPDTVKLFVGSIPPKYSAEVLRPYFSQMGEVVEISVLEGRGSGFIWYKTRAEAERAIRELDGKKPGIEPKEEHRPLEIRQARLKTDPFGLNMPGGGNGGSLSNMMSMMGLMSSPAGSNFQNIFSSMGNNPTLIIQFIDVMLQQHTQQTQFLQQIRDTVCQLNNLNSPSFAPTTPVTTPFGSTAPTPTPPSLAAFGINNNNNNIRRSVDNVLYSERQNWNNDAFNAPLTKRTSLDMPHYQDNNNNNNNNMLNARGNSTGAINQQNSAALFNLLMNNNGMDLNNLSALNNSDSAAFEQVNSLLQQQQQQHQQQQQQQQYAGDLSKMLMGMGLSDLGGMGGIDQQSLLAAMMGGAQNGGTNNMVSRAMTPTATSTAEGRRSMESVPENCTMGEDYRAGNERLLRQILEDSASLEVGQENNVPMLSTGGYDGWGYGGQAVSNQC